ncbi:MAG: hypothetical protein GX542_02440 [Rhodococcus sp.]|nr:hypothetical protein [Rhodococcus sp. (in: high G+C Gram-positive bacteria)]
MSGDQNELPNFAQVAPEGAVPGAIPGIDAWKTQVDSVVLAAWNERHQIGSVGANGKTLKANPEALRGWAADLQGAADKFEQAARLTRETLVVQYPGWGENRIPSARALADKFMAKVQGGDGIEDTNTLLGHIEAHKNWALLRKDMLLRCAAAYEGQEEALTGTLNSIDGEQQL